VISLTRIAHSWRASTRDFAAAVRANPTLAAISAEGFLTRLGFGMVGFALPLYALALGMNITEIGLLYVLRTVSTILVKPAMGWAADRFGRKSTLVVAVTLRCLVGLLFAFATQPWHLFVIRILHGAMTAARDPSATALIAEHGSRSHMATSFAWYSTARDVGRSLGYAVAGLIIQFYGSYQAVFVIAFLTSCAALFTVIRYVRESRELSRDDKQEMPALQPSAVPSVAAAPPSPEARQGWGLYRGLLGYAMLGLMVAGSAEMMRGLFPVIATQYAHLTEGQTGLIVGVAGIAILVAGPFFGWLSDNVSRKLTLGVRSLANTVSSLIYAAFPTFPGYLVARVMDDTGKAAFRPTWGAILAEVSDAQPRRRAQTMSFLDSAYTLGEVLGPLAAGLIIGGFGVPVMLGVRAAVALAAELQAVWLIRRGSPHTSSMTPSALDAHLGRRLQRAIGHRMRIARSMSARGGGQPVYSPQVVEEAHRDVVILMLIWQAGLCAPEIAALNVEDIEICNGDGRDSRGGIARVRAGAACEAREVVLNAAVLSAVNEWLKVRPRVGPALFPGLSKRRITPRVIERIVERLGYEAAVTMRVRSVRDRVVLETLTTLTPEKLGNHTNPAR
jgi:MFS family permease